MPLWFSQFVLGSCRFNATSALRPRRCRTTAWSDPGLCVFDHNFAVGTGQAAGGSGEPLVRFQGGMKCPLTDSFRFYKVWLPHFPLQAVQMLSLRFQGARLKLMVQNPQDTWGAGPPLRLQLVASGRARAAVARRR